MNTSLTKLNPLPVRTWNWLKMNETTLDLTPKGGYSGKPFSSLPSGVTVYTDDDPPFAPTQLLAGTADYVKQNANYHLRLHIGAEVTLDTPVLLDFRLDEENSCLINYLHITAEPNSCATIGIRYSGAGLHCGYTVLDVQNGAHIQLIQTQLLSGDSTNSDALQVDAAEDAAVSLLLSELGSGQAIGGCDVNLYGDGAKAEFDSVYFGTDTMKRDLNYRIGFAGKHTEGHIFVKGILDGSAHKVLKSTIDFISGASGAKGREEESVLVLSDKVLNNSSPLLLCGEDNVEGEHATSIGRPDQDKLYYLMSRGLSEKAARLLLVEASLTPVLDKIKLESLKKEISGYIQEVLHHDS